MEELPLTCGACRAENPPASLFCNSCGASQDPVTKRIDAYIQNLFQQQLAAAIKERFGDREVVELTLGAAVASRLSDWLKTAGVLVGIPLALMTAYLGFLGWDTKNTISRTREEIQSVDKNAKDAQKTLETTLNAIKSEQGQLAEFDLNMQRLQSRVAASQSQLAQLSQVTKRLDSLEGDQALLTAITKKQAAGVDVWKESSPDWQKFRPPDITFVFVRASMGTQYADPLFADHMAKAKAVGLLRGVYHVFGSGDASQQAANFLAKWNAVHGELPPVVDIAVLNNGTVAGKGRGAELLEFLNIVGEKTGCRPVIYSGANYLTQLSQTDSSLANALSAYPLWLASYEVQSPTVPKPWREWTFWQFSQTFTIDGQGPLDGNFFRGSLDDLKAFAAKSCKAH